MKGYRELGDIERAVIGKAYSNEIEKIAVSGMSALKGLGTVGLLGGAGYLGAREIKKRHPGISMPKGSDILRGLKELPVPKVTDPSSGESPKGVSLLEYFKSVLGNEVLSKKSYKGAVDNLTGGTKKKVNSVKEQSVKSEKKYNDMMKELLSNDIKSQDNAHKIKGKAAVVKNMEGIVARDNDSLIDPVKQNERAGGLSIKDSVGARAGFAGIKAKQLIGSILSRGNESKIKEINNAMLKMDQESNDAAKKQFLRDNSTRTENMAQDVDDFAGSLDDVSTPAGGTNIMDYLGAVGGNIGSSVKGGVKTLSKKLRKPVYPGAENRVVEPLDPSVI